MSIIFYLAYSVSRNVISLLYSYKHLERVTRKKIHRGNIIITSSCNLLHSMLELRDSCFNQMFKHLKGFFYLFLGFKSKLQRKSPMYDTNVFSTNRKSLNLSSISFDIFELWVPSPLKKLISSLRDKEKSSISNHRLSFSLLYILLKKISLQVVLVYNDWNKLAWCFIREWSHLKSMWSDAWMAQLVR